MSKFSIGDKVKVVQYGKPNGEYYYGGGCKDVPMGAVSIVTKIDVGSNNKKCIDVKFDDIKYGFNGEWSLCETEIELISAEYKYLNVGDIKPE